MEMDDNLGPILKSEPVSKYFLYQDWNIGFVLTGFILKLKGEIETNT